MAPRLNKIRLLRGIQLLHSVQRVGYVALAGVCYYAVGMLATHCLRIMSLNDVVGDVLASQVRYVDQGRFSGYRPVIEYRYAVGGIEHRNDSFHLAGVDNLGSRSWAEAMAAEWSAGSQCSVYYDADTPQNSCLTKQFPNCGAMTGVAICVGILFGSWCALRGLRGKRLVGAVEE